MTLENNDFFFFLQSAQEAPSYQDFSPFQLALNAEMTIEWLTLTSLATSCVII